MDLFHDYVKEKKIYKRGVDKILKELTTEVADNIIYKRILMIAERLVYNKILKDEEEAEENA